MSDNPLFYDNDETEIDLQAIRSSDDQHLADVEAQLRAMEEKFKYLGRGIGRPYQKPYEAYLRWAEEYEEDSPMDYVMWLESKVVNLFEADDPGSNPGSATGRKSPQAIE